MTLATRGTQPVEVVDYDQDWPRRYATERDRIRGAIGAPGEPAAARLPGALAWGGLPRGARVQRVGSLFPRLDAEGNVARRAG